MQVLKTQMLILSMLLSLLLPCNARGQNEHFEALLKSKAVHYAESLRDPDRYPKLIHGGNGHIGTSVFYDEGKDSVRFFQRKGDSALPIGAQIRLRFPAINNELISLQWEAMYDMAGFNGGKTYQIAWSPGGDDRLLEIQSSFVPGATPYALLHSIRTYGGGTAGGNNNPEQLSTGPLAKRNVQPALYAPIRTMKAVKHVGEGGTAFLVTPGIWVRYTLSWDLSQSPARLKFWLSDERTDETLVIADSEDRSKGFIYEPSQDNHGVDHFWFEFNNSKTKAPCDLSVWCRNFVVFRGQDVPRGGRPSK